MQHDVNALLARIAELESQVKTLSNDPFTGILNAAGALLTHPTIPANKTLIFIDMCNLHAMNHLYSMNGTNQRWIESLAFMKMRLNDVLIKWGGDEFVIIIDSESTEGFIERLDASFHANDCYAVYGVVTTSNSLQESVNRADSLVMKKKLELENAGLKPHRDAPYICLDSHVVYE